MGTFVPPALGDPQQWTVDDTSLDDAWLLSDGTVVTYLFKDGPTWSFADERLEHPGRAFFDGFGVAPDAATALGPAPGASASPSPHV